MHTKKQTLQKLLPGLMEIQKYGALGLAVTTFMGVWFLVGDILDNAGYGGYYAATIVCLVAGFIAVKFIDGGLKEMTTYAIFELLNGKITRHNIGHAIPVIMLLGLLVVRIVVSSGTTLTATKVTAVLTDVQVDRDPLAKQTQAIEGKRNSAVEGATQKRDKALDAAAAKADKHEKSKLAMIEADYQRVLGTGGFATLYENKVAWFMNSPEKQYKKYRAKAMMAEDKRKKELAALEQDLRKMNIQARQDANERYNADIAAAKTLGSSKALALMEQDLGAQEKKANILNSTKSVFIYFLDFVFLFMFLGGSISIAFYMKDVYDQSKTVLDLYPDEKGAWAVMSDAAIAIEQTFIAIVGGVFAYFQLGAARALQKVAAKSGEANRASNAARGNWGKAHNEAPPPNTPAQPRAIREQTYTPPAQSYPTSSNRQSSPFSNRPPTEREMDDKDTETDGATVAGATPQHRNSPEAQQRNSDRNTATDLSATPQQLTQLTEKQESNTATVAGATPTKRESAVTQQVGEMRAQIASMKSRARVYKSREAAYRADGKTEAADAQLSAITRLTDEISSIEAMLKSFKE